MSETKYCKGCDQSKPKSEFYSHKSTGDKLQVKCKQCMRLDTKRVTKNRPPISGEQVDLIVAMLSLLPDNMGPNSVLTEDTVRGINPGMKSVGRLITKGIIERTTALSPSGGKEAKYYKLSEDGRTIAKGMEALSRKL